LRDVTISYGGMDDNCTIYLYDKTGEHIEGLLEIDQILYEVLFGLKGVMVSRCKVSQEVINEMVKYAIKK